MPFGIAGCFTDAVWFWIAPNHVGRIDVKTGNITEYIPGSYYDVSRPRGPVVWYQDERSGKLYEVAVP